MDNPNPIRYSDLITPDDSITKLMAQLDELIAKYDAAKSKIQGAAAEIAKGLQGISGASEEQRKSIQLATEQSEKLVAEYRDVTSAQWKATQAFAEAAAAKKESAQIDKLITQINTSLEGSYNRLSAQYRLNKIRLNEMSQAEREGTESGRKLEAETKALYERMNQLQLATGKAQLQVGHYERALGNVVGVNSRFLSVLTDTNKAQETFRGILHTLATPIGVVIGVVGAATAAFKLWQTSVHETQQTGDELDREVAGWRATWDLFRKSVATMDFGAFIRGAADAARAGRELRMVIDETFERTNSARLLRASLSQENAMLEEAARNTSLSYEERRKAADQYLANMQPIYDQETETARRNRDAQLDYLFTITNKRQFATEQERKAAQEEFANNIRNYNINEQLIKQAAEYNNAVDELAKLQAHQAANPAYASYFDLAIDRQKEIVNGASESVKAFSSFARQYNLTSDAQVKAYVDAQVAYDEATAAAYNDQKRIVTLRNSLDAQETAERQKNADARIKMAEDEAKAQAKAAEEATKAQEKANKEAEAARQKEIAEQRANLQFAIQSIQLQISITQAGTTEMLNLRIAAINKQRELELFENRQKAENLRLDEKAINAKYDAMVMKETADFNQEIAHRDLAAAQDLADAEFALLNRNERQKTIFRLQQEKARLEAVLKMNETATEKLTDDEIAAIKATIAGIEKETDTLPYKNLYELLGIGLDSNQQSALNTAIDAVKDSIGSLADSWNQAAEKAVESANAQVDAAQKVLEAEIEARNAGYANSVATAQKELELARSNQQKALREKEKAQKAQLAIDSLTQSSSLVTASANLWSTLSLISPIAAVAAIATMWTSFAYAKIKAAQVTKPVETYGDGTVELLQGGSHASGHDIDLGRKPDGTRRRAEGGEYFAVINKRNSRRYGHIIPDVINSFNNGTFADRYQRANATMAGYAVGMIAGGNTDVSALERDVAAIRKQGDQSRYVDGQGNTVLRYKNLTRKIHKN